MKIELFGHALCLPAIISIAFLILSVVLAIIDNTTDLTGAGLAVGVLQAILVQYLCVKGHMKWAWFVLLLPFIMSIIMFVSIAGALTL